jgi:uncharacterized membrane protein
MSITISAREKSFAVAANRVVLGISRHWLLMFTLFWGLYVGLPWLAPIFMKIGWTDAGRAIYMIYSTQCHQLPQRSYFLFGEKSMYSLAEVQAVWRNTNNPAILRQFIGNQQMGWKVAWSDRMVSLYTAIFIGGLLYWPVRKQLKPLPIWIYALCTLPMFIDGSTHMLSDMAGIGNGFRDSNVWLAALTDNLFPAWFYAGDGLGSFNSWMRLITGVLFGIGSVWLAYPYIEQALAEIIHKIEAKFRKAGLAL